MRVAVSLTSFGALKGAVVDMDTREVVACHMVINGGFTQSKKTLSDLMEYKSYPLMDDTVKIADVIFANCFVAQERAIKTPYEGRQVLLINYMASFKSSSIDKQYFLIPKEDGLTDEEMNSFEWQEAKLKDLFFRKALEKLPLPLKKEWEEFAWKEVQNFFKPISIYGKTPYAAAYVMALPNINALQQLVEFSHKSFEFKNKFKRVPQLRSVVMGASDIENFSFPEWQKLLGMIGGQEALLRFDADRQLALVRGFETLGAIEMVPNSIELLHSTNSKAIGIMIRREKDNGKKQLIRNCFRSIMEMFADETEYLYSAINMFPKLFADNEQNIKLRNKQAIVKYLNEICYEDVIAGDMAAVCKAAKIDQDYFKEIEREYLAHLPMIDKAPRAYPTIRKQINADVSWEMIDMSNPVAWIVGIETHCCQHLRGAGGSCVRYAAKNPETSGIVRIMHKGKTVAQSFFWLSKFNEKTGLRTLCLDNIEIAGASSAELEEGSKKSFIIDAYKSFANSMERFAKLFRYDRITVGTGYMELNMSAIADRKAAPNEMAIKPESLGYSDAGSQWVVKDFV